MLILGNRLDCGSGSSAASSASCCAEFRRRDPRFAGGDLHRIAERAFEREPEGRRGLEGAHLLAPCRELLLRLARHLLGAGGAFFGAPSNTPIRRSAVSSENKAAIGAVASSTTPKCVLRSRDLGNVAVGLLLDALHHARDAARRSRWHPY